MLRYLAAKNAAREKSGPVLQSVKAGGRGRAGSLLFDTIAAGDVMGLNATAGIGQMMYYAQRAARPDVSAVGYLKK